MGRLKGRGLPSRLGSQKSRFGSAPKDERQRDRKRRERKAYRAWYHTPEWKDLREAVIDRDRMFCQRTGVALNRIPHHPKSAVVHHKIPHRGDKDLFFDIDNCELVSKQWHDTEGQKEDQNQV